MDLRKFLFIVLIIFTTLSFHSSANRIPRSFAEKNRHGSVIQLMHANFFAGFDPTRVTQLSWRPRAFLHREFLSEEECDHLIKLAKNKLEKSMVIDESGNGVENEGRTSSGMFITDGQDDTIARIEARIATWTFIPVENGEHIQILKYEIGQKYSPHYDYFPDKLSQKHPAGNRLATVIMYLSDVEEGGETVFLDSEAAITQSKGDQFSDCAKEGYAVKAKKGSALLFFNLHPNATADPLSVHESCPVLKGEKWSATKWIRVRSPRSVKTLML